MVGGQNGLVGGLEAVKVVEKQGVRLIYVWLSEARQNATCSRPARCVSFTYEVTNAIKVTRVIIVINHDYVLSAWYCCLVWVSYEILS